MEFYTPRVKADPIDVEPVYPKHQVIKPEQNDLEAGKSKRTCWTRTRAIVFLRALNIIFSIVVVDGVAIPNADGLWIPGAIIVRIHSSNPFSLR